MAEQEKEHLKKFDELMERHRVRPTVLTPLWRVAGFVLGASTALMGREAAMACTVAVETTVGHHYNDQLRVLQEHNMNSPPDQELRQVMRCRCSILDLRLCCCTVQVIRKFRDDELEHLDIGLKNDAEKVHEREKKKLKPLAAAADSFLAQAPLYGLMSKTIELGSKAAIWLSTRI